MLNAEAATVLYRSDKVRYLLAHYLAIFKAYKRQIGIKRMFKGPWGRSRMLSTFSDQFN